MIPIPRTTKPAITAGFEGVIDDDAVGVGDGRTLARPTSFGKPRSRRAERSAAAFIEAIKQLRREAQADFAEGSR